MTTDTIPGEDVTAEAMVLGVLLCEPSMIPDVRGLLQPEHFYRPEHGAILRTLYRLADTGDCNPLAVKIAMAADGTLASIGHAASTEAAGTDYLRDLCENCGYAVSNLEYNARTVRGGADLREAIRLADAMKADAKRTAAHDVGEYFAKYQARLFELDQRGDTAGKPAQACEAVAEGLEHAAAVRAGTVSPGLATGFSPIDRALCGGFHPGDLITLAAATSVGKTALGLTVAANVARGGGAVFFVSCEMDRRSIGYRLLAAEARIPAYALRTDKLSEQEEESREEAVAEIRRWRFSIHDRASTVGEIAMLARQAAARWREPLAMIVVDYLQLLLPTSGETRAQQVGGIAWGLKRLAAETRTPVLMLSQLNREGVKGGTPPSLYALKESGDVENHSNAVILLHRPEPVQFDTDGAVILWAKVAKARDGMTTAWTDGKGNPGIRLRFKTEYTKFEPLTL